MTTKISTASNQNDILSIWERWATLLGRLLIYFGMIYSPLVFFTWTWRHYHVPKVSSFQWIVLLLVACWGVIAARRRFVRSALATPVAFFFAIVMLTSLLCVDLTEAWETIIFILATMVYMLLIPKFMTRKKDLEILIYLLGMMCVIVNIYALGQKFNWESLFLFTEKYLGIRQMTPKPVSFMGNENYVAQFYNMVLPVCFAMMLCYKHKPAQLIFFSIITLLNSIVMIYIDCNASYAGFIVSIPIATILMIYFKVIPWTIQIGLFQRSRKELERRFRQIIVVGVLGISLISLLVVKIPNPLLTKMVSIPSWMDVNGDLIPDGVAPIVFRLQCMDAAARNIVDSPLWGVGAGNYKIAHTLYESQLERKVLGEETLAREVHNDHLQRAVEFGVFGLFGWYWIMTATIFAILCSLRMIEFQSIAATEKKSSSYQGILFHKDTRDFYFYLQWGILAGLIVAFVSCGFDQTFEIASGTITFWLLCGIGVTVYQNLHLAKLGLRNHFLGTTPEPLTPIQTRARLIPSPVVWAILFSFVLILGTWNTYQLVGETWLRQGMSEKDDEPPNYYGMFKYFNKSFAYYPYQMETFYILGRFYIDAVVDLETAMYATQAGEQPKIPLGLNVDDRRRYNEEGIVVLQTDIFLNPNYKWAHNNLGVLYDRLYDLIKPEKEESVGPLFHVTPEPEQAIAVMEASKEAYRRVLVVDDEQIYAHFNLGLGAIKLKQFSRAIDSLNRALITDPSRYDIYKYLSSCYVQTKEYKRALRATEKYLEKELLVQVMKKRPKSQDRSNYEQIMQSLREGDYAKAVTQARLIMQWENFDIYQQYLTIAKDISDNDDVENSDIALTAIEMAEKVIATPRPEYYLYYAKIYERLNKLDSAAKCVEDYLRVRPDDDEIRQSLMLLYVKLNDFPHAQKTMAVLVEKDPNNWTNLVTYARLLSGVNTPWSQIFPYVERAIQNGGDEARRAIAEDQPGNLILPYVKQDPRMLELLGPAFLPASSTQPSVELQPVPGIDASNQPVPSDESAIPTPQSGDSESAPIPQSASQ